MKNLILTIRLHSALKTIKRIKEIQNDIEKNRWIVNDLDTILHGDNRRDPTKRNGISSLTIDIATNIEKAISEFDALDKEFLYIKPSKPTHEYLPRIQMFTGRAKQIIRATRNDLSRLGEKNFELLKCVTQLEQQIEQFHTEELLRLTHQVIQQDADDIEQELYKLNQRKNNRSAWQSFIETTKDKLDPIGEKYVDIIGGFALREEGFDNHTCLIADELLTEGFFHSLDFPFNGVTVPAVQQVKTRALARIIHLGFPEWTLWAIPLIVHEFCRIAVESKAEENGIIIKSQQEDTEASMDRVLLADLFATRFMGPAYANACILLRLNPNNQARSVVGVDRSSAELDGKRISIILYILGKMSNATPLSTYEGTIYKLKEQWNEIADTKIDIEQLDQSQRQYIDKLDDWVYKKLSEMLFQEESWNNAMKFKGQLADLLNSPAEQEDDGIITKDNDRIITFAESYTIVELLNGAWESRLHYLEKSDDIAEVIKHIMKEKYKLRQAKQVPSNIPRNCQKHSITRS